MMHSVYNFVIKIKKWMQLYLELSFYYFGNFALSFLSHYGTPMVAGSNHRALKEQ